jgi:ribonuclease Z
MPILHLLGTGAAVSDPHRTTTMLAFEGDDAVVVVDCGGDVIQRLMASRVPLDKITAMIVTHEHPDHVGGFPLFMEKLWLSGRRHPIPVYGIKPAIDQAKRAFEAFDTSPWEGMPEIAWHEVALEEGARVLSDATWQITAAPGHHAVPVIGLRVQHNSGKVVTYSCDTERSSAIMRLSSDADILVHEATGEGPGHSSARTAAAVAREANAKRLLLVHLPPEENLGENEMQEARKIFSSVEKGEEGGRYPY